MFEVEVRDKEGPGAQRGGRAGLRDARPQESEVGSLQGRSELSNQFCAVPSMTLGVMVFLSRGRCCRGLLL